MNTEPARVSESNLTRLPIRQTTGDRDRGLQPANSHHWVRVVSGIDFSTAAVVAEMPAKKRPAGRTIKGVAFRLAWWADTDGGSIFPSVAAISAACDIDYTVVKRCLQVLRAVGLLDGLSHGGGSSGRGTRYRLTVPADLLARVKYRGPEAFDDLMRKIVPPSCRARNPEGIHPLPEVDANASADEACPELGGDAPPARAEDSEGMGTPEPDPSGGTRRGCTPEPVDKCAGNSEGMHPQTGGTRRGCTPELGGDAPPRTYQDLPDQKHLPTSPKVSTSPATISSSVDLDSIDAADMPPTGRAGAIPIQPPSHIEACRAAVAASRARNSHHTQRPEGLKTPA